MDTIASFKMALRKVLMRGKCYPEEFKVEAVKLVIKRDYSISSVVTRFDITTQSLLA